MPGDEDADGLPEYPGRFDAMPIPAAACAPLGFNGGRSELKSRLRSALSPWFECRYRVDIIRDALDRRASALVPQGEAARPTKGAVGATRTNQHLGRFSASRRVIYSAGYGESAGEKIPH